MLAIGLLEGDTVLVHSAMGKMGYVCGGAQAVIEALENVLTDSGTLVIPAHSGVLSDPATWNSPPVPQEWWQPMKETMPPFRCDLTPTYLMGTVAETFRKQNGVRRSNHPYVSFAALGPKSAFILDNHGLDFSLGENSPLARLYELDSKVLLLGVGHANNTSLHLAEYRSERPDKKIIKSGAPVLVNGIREWIEFNELEFDDTDFMQIGADFEADLLCATIKKIGMAESRLMPMRILVDFATSWMECNRTNSEE